jgi:hypothetical protein
MQPRTHSLPTVDASTQSVCFSLKAAVKPIGMLLLRLPRGQLPHFSKTCLLTNFGFFSSARETQLPPAAPCF